MYDSMAQIHKLSKERQELWRLAGKGQITNQQREHIGHLTGKLDSLWDQHRREVASRVDPKKDRGYLGAA